MLLMNSLAGFEIHLTHTGKSIATIRSYMTSVNQFIQYIQMKENGPVFVSQVKEQDINEFLHYLRTERNLQPTTINTYLNGIRNLFKYSIRQEIIEKDPTIYVESVKENQKRRDFLTALETQQLLSIIDHPLVNLVVRTLAYTGLRISECLSLEEADINFTEDKIHVRNGKGSKPRTIPLPKELKVHLIGYRDGPRTYIKNSAFFFATTKSGSISSAYINRLLGDAVEKLGWSKHVTCHTLRHSFATQLVRKGTNLPTVAALLGHADFRTVTSVYIHIEHDELQAAINQIELEPEALEEVFL